VAFANQRLCLIKRSSFIEYSCQFFGRMTRQRN